MSDRLDDIITYDMSKDEAIAFKAALIWENVTRETCPGEHCGRIGKGDPRKSNLFRYCYKMVMDTKGILEITEIKNYIKAQVQVMKSITDGRSHADVCPQILAGPKAWTRWKMWQARHDRDMAKPVSVEHLAVSADDDKVMIELERTSEFLNKAGKPIEEIEPKTLLRWIKLGKISPYWVLMDERLEKYRGEFDKTLYEKDISPAVRQWFKDKV